MNYRRLFLSTVVTGLGLGFGSANAADLYRPAPTAPVVTQPIVQSLWSGFYLGVHAGVGGGRTDYPFNIDFANVIGASGKGYMDGGGFVAGGQVGYNFVLSNRVLLGVEADISWSDIESRIGIGGSGRIGGSLLGRANASAGTGLDYLGTVRARLGYVVTDPWLVYATGGWAYGRTNSSVNLSVSDANDTLFRFNGSKKNDLSGWAAGLGTAYAITPNLSLRAEYMHVDLGSGSLLSLNAGGFRAGLKVDPQYDIVRVGLDYRFDATAPATTLSAPAWAAPVAFNWSGLHVGVNGGYGYAKNDYPIDIEVGPFSGTGTGSGKGGGFLAGGQVGYDFQFGRIVAGVEADIAWADVQGQLGLDGRVRLGPSSAGFGASLGSDLDYLGTVRARLGYAVTDPWLVYATGGWAYARTTSSLDFDLAGAGLKLSKKLDHSGWAAGLGTEFAISQNLTVRVEYLHADLDAKTLYSVRADGARASIKLDPDYDILRVGVNYKFDFGASAAAPVVAKY